MVGQSFGGATSITLASLNIPSLAGAVNFAGGGGGGDPIGHPESPCSAYRLTAMFKGYGKTSSVPTLWLYSANDRYFGTQYPQEWFESFLSGGGKGTFVQLPAYKENGHGVFSSLPESWHSAFEDYLKTIGFGK